MLNPAERKEIMSINYTATISINYTTCMYNNVPITCFGRFLTGHHQVGYNVGGTIYLL